MKDILCNVRLDDEGQDVAEYALLLATILAVVITGLTAIGTQVNVVFDAVRAALGG